MVEAGKRPCQRSRQQTAGMEYSEPPLLPVGRVTLRPLHRLMCLDCKGFFQRVERNHRLTNAQLQTYEGTSQPVQAIWAEIYSAQYVLALRYEFCCANEAAVRMNGDRFNIFVFLVSRLGLMG